MREYLFRAKPYEDVDFDEIGVHIKKEDFVYGNLLIDGKDAWIINGVVESNSEYITIERWIPVRPETVGQFTNLYDKNKTKIFDGDLLKDSRGHLYEVQYDETDGMFVIEWKGYDIVYHFGDEDSKWHEVYGNIHDSKDEVEE